MYVVATAGHIDHGKSTLVRALTGIEPDRFDEERRRGMTLDLGFAWMRLGNGELMSFVDVPGHSRFVPTMMAGAGPVRAAMLVVAADEGWQAQTTDHVAILDALKVEHGLLVVTKSDVADPGPVLQDATERLRKTSLGTVEGVAVSTQSGEGIPALKRALSRLAMRIPEVEQSSRVRFFIDRAFTVRGSGTVVTGTLGAGAISTEDALDLHPGKQSVQVKRLQVLNTEVQTAEGVARVALNLRGVPVRSVHRGSVLLSPGEWMMIEQFDARLAAIDPSDLPGTLVFHFGTAAVSCRLRPFGEDTCRVQLSRPLPMQVGDRAVLRDPSTGLTTGVTVLDADPPEIRRRGAAKARAKQLENASELPDLRYEVERRGAMTMRSLRALGIWDGESPMPEGIDQFDDYAVDSSAWERWRSELNDLVETHHNDSPLESGISEEAVRRGLGLPDRKLVRELVSRSKGRLTSMNGRIAKFGSGPVFRPHIQDALREYRERLEADPFDAPDATELAKAGITARIMAAAERAGYFLRLQGGILVHPNAVEISSQRLMSLSQPFTMSAARDALGTTRRIAMPLLEHLDEIGVSRRVDDDFRRVLQ